MKTDRKYLINAVLLTVFFLAGIIWITNESISNANNILDPIIQYDQSDAPYIAFGGTPSGDYNDLNVLGEDLTYDIPEAQEGALYRLEIWHNSSQIADGTILSVNVTINFTTNVSDDYSLQIYDFANSEWASAGCDSGSVLADTPTQWWCNKTSSPMNYNSSDRIIRIRINSTADSDAGLLKEDYVQYYIGYQAGYLEVNITNPDTSLPKDVIQNHTFSINATVICRDGPCGEVTGIVRYNLTSSDPDTPINTTAEDKPFYIQENPASALKSCGVVYRDQTCQLNWTVNATGDTDTSWKIGVLFNSSYPEIQENHTSNATLSILSCTVDFNVAWSSINFGPLNPNTYNNSASGNENNTYNISVNPGSCNTTFYVRGSDLTNTTYNSVIKVGNLSWSNISSNIDDGYFILSDTNSVIKLNVSQNTNVTTWYWLNVPPIYAGVYNGTVYITGVKSE